MIIIGVLIVCLYFVYSFYPSCCRLKQTKEYLNDVSKAIEDQIKMGSLIYQLKHNNDHGNICNFEHDVKIKNDIITFNKLLLNDSYIRLIFHEEGEIIYRHLPKQIIQNYPTWCLSNMLNDIGNCDELNMKDIMSLEVFDAVTSYFSGGNSHTHTHRAILNPWKLDLNTIFLLCKQGLIVSPTCNELMTSKNPYVLKFMCQLLEFELNRGMTKIHCNSVDEYKIMHEYFKNNNSITSYQIIRYKCYGKTINIPFINGIPMMDSNENVEDVYEYVSNLTHLPNSNLSNPIMIDIGYLLPENFVKEYFVGGAYATAESHYNRYYPDKLKENQTIWNIVSRLYNGGRVGVKGPKGAEGYSSYRPRPRPIKFISPTNTTNAKSNSNIDVSGDKYILEIESAKTIIEIYCGYVKLI